MSGATRSGTKVSMKSGSGKNQQDRDEKPAVRFLPPLKPRPVLTIVLFVAVVAWLAALVAMRLTMVRPYQAAPATTAPTTR